MNGGLVFLLVVAGCLAGLGAFGMMARRNAVTALCSAQLLVLGAVVAVLGLGAFSASAAARPAAVLLAIVLGLTLLAQVAMAMSLARAAGPLTPIDDAPATDG